MDNLRHEEYHGRQCQPSHQGHARSLSLGLWAGPGPWARAWAQAAAHQGPPKGQGSGSGPDPDDLVVTDDHDIPHVSDNPKSTLASLNLLNLSPESLRWVLVV